MPLWVPGDSGPFYNASFCSVGATRPAAAFGTSVTPAQNAFGTAAQVLTAGNVSFDVYGIQINFNSGGTSTAIRDMLCNIGVDPAGGTSYTTLIPNLIASCSAPYMGASGTGHNYFFPVFIKSGSTVSCAASVNNATVGTMRCWMRIFGKPRDRRMVKVGTRVVAYGITAASSQGTAVTAGTAAEGSYTTLGTIAGTDNPWFWQVGMGISNGTITALSYSGDLGIGAAGTEKTVIEQRLWQGSTTEMLWDEGVNDQGFYRAKNGDLVRGRLQCSGTAVTGLYMAAYGVV
jgi:hypothetical protein